MAMLDSFTLRKLPPRTKPIKAIVIHNTGNRDLDEILRFYQDPNGYQPHYLIETTGTVRRIAPEDKVAWHAKIDEDEARLYAQGWQTWSHMKWVAGAAVQCGSEYPGYREWRETWLARGYQSPLDLVTDWHPNLVTVGIELQNPTYPTKDLYTAEQYAALAELLVDVGNRNHVPLRRTEVLGHYDVSPMRRCSSTGNWDPGPLKWNRIWDLIRTASPMT